MVLPERHQCLLSIHTIGDVSTSCACPGWATARNGDGCDKSCTSFGVDGPEDLRMYKNARIHLSTSIDQVWTETVECLKPNVGGATVSLTWSDGS